ARWFDPIGIMNLTVTAEYNSVSAYTYSDPDPLINYSHYNQELAHPYGAGLNELVFTAYYLHTSRFWISYKLNLANMPGTWNDPNNGKNVFTAYNPAETPNNDQSKLEFHEFKIGYRCNVKTNMNVFLGVNYRDF